MADLFEGYGRSSRTRKGAAAWDEMFADPARPDDAHAREPYREIYAALARMSKDELRGRTDALAMAAGDISERSLLMRDGLPSDTTRQDLIDAGAVGDVLGYVLDAEGRLVDHRINSRVIGIELDDLRAIPNVILAAGGAHKVPIIRAVLRLGVINTIVTDEETARALLNGGDTP